MRPRLREILDDALAREPDIALVARNLTSDAALVDVRPDVVVCEAANALDPSRPKALLQVLPRARVLMIAHSGRQAVVFELRPTRLVLREVSMRDIVDAVRTAIQGDGARWEPIPDDPPTTRGVTSRLADSQHEIARRPQLRPTRVVSPRASWREKP
jgi:hypothetical protein